MLTDTITITPETLHDRLVAWEGRQRAQLLEEATAAQLQATVDAITGGWAVRSPSRPGYVEIVTADGCTCQEYAVLKECPHAELVRRIDEDTAALFDLLMKALDFQGRFDGDLPGYTLGRAIVALCTYATKRESLRNRVA